MAHRYNKNNLTRDYVSKPLVPYEHPCQHDLKYLYLDCDFTQQQVANILGCNITKIFRYCKKYKLIKDKQHIIEQTILKQKRINAQRTEEQKRKISEAHKRYWNSLSDEQKQDWKQRVSQNSKNMWKTRNKQAIQQTLQKMSNSAKLRISQQTFEQKQNRINAFKVTWYKASKEQQTMRKKKNSDSKKQWWQQLTSDQKQLLKQKAALTRHQWIEEYKQQIQDKIYKTKKKNKSFNKSTWEEYVKHVLQQYTQIKCQYKCKKYPFACDFYIPEKDLFIECNFHWTHGKEPYNKNNKKHIQLLNYWKEKSKTSKYYNNAIYVWTQLDVRKLQIAQQNNINLLRFYNKHQFNKWLEGEVNGT